MSEYGPYDADEPPPLVFDQWAEVSAQLAAERDRERTEVLEERGIDEAQFDAVNAYWLAELAREIQAGDLEHARRYGEVCRHRRVATEKERAARDASGGSVDETAWMVAAVSEPTLPFKGSVATAPHLSETVQAERAAGVGETAQVQAWRAEQPALPFASRASDEDDDER